MVTCHLKYCALGVLGLLPTLAIAQTCKPSDASGPIPDIRLIQVAEGLDSPVAITHANDGSGRLFVLEQEGLVRVIKNKTLHPKPFLDIRQRVTHGGTWARMM
ncbi:MAG TPA: hypothetical protein ENI80_03645 [Acidiferrobacteraceae bacterium]|nr:hypothetical protein [Acidiferrobacteraceae bacterium]